MIASSLKCVSDFTADFFSSEKELFSWIFLLQKTSRRTKILISPVWNKILKNWDTLFEVVNIIGVQCIKNYIKFCFTTRSWSFWTEHRKGTAKVTSGIENFLYILYIYWEYLLCPQSNASGSFLQKVYWFCRTATQIFSL